MSLMPSIVNGISMGAIYGLIAMGLTLIFGTMRVTNFAHGAFMMIAMMIAYTLWGLTGINPYLLIILVGPLMFLFGYATQMILIRPVLAAESDKNDPISVLLLTAGLSIVLENLALMIFGADYRMAQTSFSNATFTFGNVTLSAARFYGLIITLAISVGLWIFLQKTETGRQLRATGQDRNTAALMGINSERIFAIAFGIGTALLAVAGLVLLPFYYVSPSDPGLHRGGAGRSGQRSRSTGRRHHHWPDRDHCGPVHHGIHHQRYHLSGVPGDPVREALRSVRYREVGDRVCN